MSIETEKKQRVVITSDELLDLWQGHRGLTRKVIEAFPEKEFFNFSIGGMRPFAGMVAELRAIAVPGIREIVTGKTGALSEDLKDLTTKEAVLKKWDEDTESLKSLWEQLPVERFHDNIKAFGQYEGSVISTIHYYIDNEVHHRGQAYVYLRALGIEPPAFWDRRF